MANISGGNMFTFGYVSAYGSQPTAGPLRNQTDAPGFGARVFNALLPAAGLKTVYGHAYESSAGVRRHIVIMTQPPKSVVVWETCSNATTGVFTFPRYLPAGNYMVIDAMTDNSRRALVYDWVVAG